MGSIYKRSGHICRSDISLDVEYFKDINSNEKAYWLGYICADGSIRKTNNKVTLASKDYNVIVNFKQAIKSEHAISKNTTVDKRTNKLYQSWSIQICNTLFVSYLLDLGITSNKSDNLVFPNIAQQYYSYFIAGLFDGDGSVFLRGKMRNQLAISLISTKEVLQTIFTYLFNNFNIKPTRLYLVSKNKTNVWKFILYKDALKFLNVIYSDLSFKCYLQRKYNLYDQYK